MAQRLNSKQMVPLSRPKRAILVSLMDSSKHGYGVMKHAKSVLAVRLPTGTLYRNIADLLDDKLIEECDPPLSEPESDVRRQYYRITGAGERIVEADWAYQQPLAVAQQRLLEGFAAGRM